MPYVARFEITLLRVKKTSIDYKDKRIESSIQNGMLPPMEKALKKFFQSKDLDVNIRSGIEWEFR